MPTIVNSNIEVPTVSDMAVFMTRLKNVENYLNVNLDDRKIGLYLPLFIYPTRLGSTNATALCQSLVSTYNANATCWKIVSDLIKKYPHVEAVQTINPSNGDFTSRSADIANGLTVMKQAGNIRFLGYTYVSPVPNGTYRGFDAMAQVLRNYQTYYPEITGLFLDNFWTGTGHEADTEKLVLYAKSLGFKEIWANPGTAISESYINLLDTVLIQESIGYPVVNGTSSATLQSRTFNKKYSRKKFCSLPHHLSSFNYDWLESARQHVYWFNLTDSQTSAVYDMVSGYQELLCKFSV